MEKQFEIDYHVIKGNDENENDIYVVNQLVFTDLNMLHRFGEFLSVMNDLDKFYMYNVTDDLNQQVGLNYDDEDPFEGDGQLINEYIEENYDKKGVIVASDAQVVDQDRVDTDQVKNIG